MPATLQGGARAMTFNGLLIRGWIIETGDSHLLTDAGYATIGQQRPPPPIYDSPARDSVHPCRPGTKLAKVSAALQNPDGATIFQLMCCTGWQPHTIRGANRKRCNLGLHPDGSAMPRCRLPYWNFARKDPCRLDDTQRVSGSCIHAGMSRWPCSTRQTSMCSARSM